MCGIEERHVVGSWEPVLAVPTRRSHPACRTPMGTLRQRASQRPAGEGFSAGSDLPSSPSSSPPSHHSSLSQSYSSGLSQVHRNLPEIL